MRDDFSSSTKRRLAECAGYVCSNPNCRRNQLGPAPGDTGSSVNLGKAAHIRAASGGGPRYDANQTPEQRSSIDNGIYLCGGCADLIDKNNGSGHPVALLVKWKMDHEVWIAERLNKGELDMTTFKHVIWQDIQSSIATIGHAHTVNIVKGGLSEADVRRIATDLFDKNFLRLAEDAAALAVSRAEEITGKFIHRLKTDDVSLETVGDPATQSALFDAQKAYALSGDRNKLGVLSDILLERCRASKSSFVELNMDQAISACSKMTSGMLDSLSVQVAVRYSLAREIGGEFSDYLITYVQPFADTFASSKAECDFLDSQGCIAIQRGMIQTQSIAKIWLQLYPEVFRFLPDKNELTVRDALLQWCPNMARVFEKWDGTALDHSSLTSVGATIGLANLKQKTDVYVDFPRWIHV